MAQRAGVGASSFCVDTELAIHLGEKLRAIPLIGVLLARAEGVDELARDVFRDAENVVALIFSFERGTADGVDGLALLVHYVVVFEQRFAVVEVLRVAGVLRPLDAPGHQFPFNIYAFGPPYATHHTLLSRPAPHPHHLVSMP